MSVVFGIVLGLCGSIAINTGNNFQSHGMHKLELDESHSENDNLCKSTWWVMGTVIFVTGALLNFASFGFAPQSTLASLESVQFVSNIIFGKLLLQKVITRRMMIGTSLTVGGTILAVCFSSKEAAMIEDVQDLVDLWNNPFWIAYVTILVILAVAIYFAYQALDQRKDTSDLKNVMATMYAVFSALFGTLSVVFAKLLAKLLELQAQDANIFSEWYTYMTAVCWLLLMAFWLYRLNKALSLYDPVFIIPLLQSNFIFFANISGGLYFKEFNYMEPGMWVGFSSGVIVMFVGIFLLVPSKDRSEIHRSMTEKTIADNGAPKNMKGVVTFLMTGACRMHQHHFDFKTQMLRNERRIAFLGSKNVLTPDEKNEMEQLMSQVHKTEVCLKEEDELAIRFKAGNIDAIDAKEIRVQMENIMHKEISIEKHQKDLDQTSIRDFFGEVVSEEAEEAITVVSVPESITLE